MTSSKPDFDALRKKRDDAIEAVAREMHVRMGGDPNEAPTFHSRDHGAPCYCACPEGPCEHEFEGWRDFEDGLGGERVCKRCGLGNMGHDLRFAP